MDNGITVPHAKTNVVTRPSLAALRLSTPVQYNAEGGAAAEDDSSTKDSFGRSLYKNLMNGVSHMLPFVVGNGIVNYVMGLCFVSEGAIPYAAADPLRVLPSCVVGSAVAGALSMTFGCALRAPHGGIFVFPVVDHAVLYCVALAVGSVLGAVILSLVKKTQPAEAK